MKASKEFFGKFAVPSSPCGVISPSHCKSLSCLLCERDTPATLILTSTWCEIAQVALYCLHRQKCAEYLSLKDDIYPFVHEHMEALRCSQTTSPIKWKRLLYETLLQNNDTFETNNGQEKEFWKLIMQTDPWLEDPIAAQRKLISQVYHPGTRDRRRRTTALPYLHKRAKVDEVGEFRTLEEEFCTLRQEMENRMCRLRQEVSYYRTEIYQQHNTNIERILQMDELLGTFTPGIISTLQKYIYMSSKQAQPEDQEEAAKTVMAIEGLEQIHNSCLDNKDMRHCLSFIMS